MLQVFFLFLKQLENGWDDKSRVRIKKAAAYLVVKDNTVLNMLKMLPGKEGMRLDSSLG